MKNIANALILAMSMGVISPSNAATVALATAPLFTASTSEVRPNLMFVLDNSGSMGWDYLPDIVGDYSGDVTLDRNAKFNGVAYDPSIRYIPPANFNADGTENTTAYPSQTGVDAAHGANSDPKPNWKSVEKDAYQVQSTSNSDVQTTASTGKIFGFVPGEICTAIDLIDCIAGTVTTTARPYAASLRWCSSGSAARASTVSATGSDTCRATYIAGAYEYPRYPTVRTATILIEGSNSTSVSNIKVNGVEILSAPTTATTSASTQATNIVNAINACNGSVVGNCGAAGYGAIKSGSSSPYTVTIYANAQTTLGTPTITDTGSMTLTPSAFVKKANAATSGTVNTPGYNLIRIIPAVGTTALYPAIGASAKATARTDCAGTLCTANEELTNYANWYTYYQTRMQMMKTGTSNAFKSVGANYRVGFNMINSGGNAATGVVLGNDLFQGAHKATWYTKLFAADPDGSTPLRSALTVAGKYYGGKIGTDPVEYSCQQNFTLLSTDGYWNDDVVIKDLNGASVSSSAQDQDGGTTPRPKYEGSTVSKNTLADFAKYYADTDLRNSSWSNCLSGSGSGEDVCKDDVFTSSTDTNTKQHMTTFTLGLGADGRLVYQSDYLTATTGDYTKLVAGTLSWPVPVSGKETTIDDLWHAAVNANGQYFSAKSPTQLSDGLKTALAAINAKVGAGAAAATSNLNPVAGDNYAYVASYTTTDWYGNLEQRSVNTTTGVVSEDANWCVENITADVCASPSYTVTDTSGGSTQISCVTPSSTLATCTGTFDSSTNKCSVPMASSCIGTLPLMVAANSDTRTIYMASSGALANFNLSSFDPTLLSQYSTLSATQQANMTTANLVNYLRGRKGYEISGSNAVDNQVFRYRKAVMGDAIESTPAYIKKPVYSYADPGYSTFVTAQSGRAGAVYLGTNDGMLHAFNATTGVENWAFVPTPVIPNMYKLADKDYANLHTYYVNGDITIDDICTANCTTTSATWKTILVGGLHAGGRGYYALDITNPTSPSLLWEYTSSDNANLGYSFGRPIVTKKTDGTWVVLLTTGYNNSADGSLLVLNAATGGLISTVSTGAGSDSGLAQINDYVANLSTNNTAGYVYGGDLLGNLWRFDINAATVMKFAQLTDGTNPQPITVRPELGTVNTTRMVYIGTGKYLEANDLTSAHIQTLYGISDPDVTATLVNPRSTLVQQTLSTVSGTAYRTVSNNPIPASSRGWYIDLPDTGERQNVASVLASGTLIVPSNVPTNTACSPGGYGYVNYVDYKTGGAVTYNNPSAYGSTKTNSMVVGLNVLYIGASYTPILNVVTADNPTPQKIPVPFANSSSSFQGRRVIWRELMN